MMPIPPIAWSMKDINWHCDALATALHDQVAQCYDTRFPHIAAPSLAENIATAMAGRICRYDIENIFETLDAVCIGDRANFLRLWDGAWILKIRHMPPELRAKQWKRLAAHRQNIAPQKRHALINTLIQQYCPSVIHAVKEHIPARNITPTQQTIFARKAQRLGWLTLRFQIMKRDGYCCRLCGHSPSNTLGTILEVDHITPRSKGGNNDPINLWTLCFDCNRGKRDKEL